MHHRTGGEPQRRLDGVGFQAADRPGVGGIIADQAARQLQPRLVAQHHAVALFEPAVDGADACRQQALAPSHRCRRAGVQAQRSGRGQRSGDPGLVGCGRRGGRRDDGGQSPILDGLQGSGSGAQGDQGRAAGGAGDPRRGQLGGHAADSNPGADVGPAGHGFDLGRQLGDAGHMPGAGIVAWIGGVEAIDIGQQHQRLGAHQLGHPSREPVVVADPDLLGDHRVVLIDHWDHAQAQQGLQGRPGVQPAVAHLGVVSRQQHLGADQAVGLQRLFPGPHQRRLAGGGGGLFLGQRQLAPSKPQAATTQGHGAGRHHQHLLAARPQPGQVGGEVGQPGAVRRAVLADQQC